MKGSWRRKVIFIAKKQSVLGGQKNEKRVGVGNLLHIFYETLKTNCKK